VFWGSFCKITFLNENFKMAKFLSKTVSKTDGDNTGLLALSTLDDATQNMIVSLLCSIAQGSNGK
jgi:hypothetical protein